VWSRVAVGSRCVVEHFGVPGHGRVVVRGARRRIHGRGSHVSFDSS
jgi:hypothetical protein